MSRSIDTFSDVVAQVYASAFDPTNWRDCLLKASALLESSGAHVYAFDATTGAFDAIANYEVPLTDEYLEATRWYSDPRVEWALRQGRSCLWHDGLVHGDRDVWDFEFNRWVEAKIPGFLPFGYSRHTRGGGFQVLSICRYGPNSVGPSDEDLRLLTLLIPHVDASFRASQRLSAAAAAWETVEKIRSGVVFFDCAGRVTATNAQADEITRRADGLFLSGCSLSAGRANEDRALQRALARAVRLSRGDATVAAESELQTTIRVSRPSGRAPYVVTINPCPEGAACNPFPEAPCVMALIEDTDAETDVDPALLSFVFSLTEAEARVAALIVERASVHDVARRLSVSDHAVRYHLQSCFRKMNVKSQKDLAALILKTTRNT